MRRLRVRSGCRCILLARKVEMERGARDRKERRDARRGSSRAAGRKEERREPATTVGRRATTGTTALRGTDSPVSLVGMEARERGNGQSGKWKFRGPSGGGTHMQQVWFFSILCLVGLCTAEKQESETASSTAPVVTTIAAGCLLLWFMSRVLRGVWPRFLFPPLPGRRGALVDLSGSRVCV